LGRYGFSLGLPSVELSGWNGRPQACYSISLTFPQEIPLQPHTFHPLVNKNIAYSNILKPNNSSLYTGIPTHTQKYPNRPTNTKDPLWYFNASGLNYFSLLIKYSFPCYNLIWFLNSNYSRNVIEEDWCGSCSVFINLYKSSPWTITLYDIVCELIICSLHPNKNFKEYFVNLFGNILSKIFIQINASTSSL